MNANERIISKGAGRVIGAGYIRAIPSARTRMPENSRGEEMNDQGYGQGDGQDKSVIWQRDEIESPCIQICVIHPDARLCTGCYRSIDEISAWSRLSPEARRAIMADLPSRAGQLRKRRGGREARVQAVSGSAKNV